MSTQKPILPGLEGSNVSNKPILPGLDVKKKEFTEEQLKEAETSLKGYSVVSQELKSEVPSITKESTELDIVQEQIKNITDLRDKAQAERMSYAQRKISLEREKKQLERQLSSLRGSLSSPTGRTSVKIDKSKQQIQERLKEINDEFKVSDQDLQTTIDKERDLEQAHDFLKKSETLLEQPNDNSLKTFKEGLFSPLAKDFFTLGVSQMASQYNIMDIANKYREEGEEALSKEERATLGAYGMFLLANQQPQSVTFNVGKAIAEMIPYMAQFALTGGVGDLAKGATQTLLKAGTKKGIQKALSQGTAFAAGALARTPLMTMTQEGYARRRTGLVEPKLTNEGIEGEVKAGTEDSVGEAAYKAFATTFAEVFTEELGGIVTKPLGKLANRIGINSLTKNIDNAIISRIKDVAKFNGVVGEYSEELINSYLQASLTRDQPLSEVWNGKQQLETLLTVGTMGSLFMVANVTLPKSKKNKSKLSDERTKSFDKINDQYKEEVQKISDIEDVTEKATVMEQYLYEKNIESDQLKNIVEYLTYDNTIKSIDVVEDEIRPETKIKADTGTQIVSEEETTTEQKEAVKQAKIKKTEVKDVQEQEKMQEEALQKEQEIQAQVEVLEKEKDSLQKTLERVPEDQKPKIEREISDVNQQIETLKEDAEKITQVRQEVTEEVVQREEQLGDMQKQPKEEAQKKVEPYKTKEEFKKDFLSNEVIGETGKTIAEINLQDTNVPGLKTSEKISAAKNLREGKMTKQAEILKDYLNKAFESGTLEIIPIKAGGKSVKTNMPITEIARPQQVIEETPLTNKRAMGQKALDSKVLNSEVKAKIKQHGIDYFVRGDQVVTEEANEIARIYQVTGNRDGLKSLILDTTNNIKGDTRTELAVAYAEETQKLVDTAKTVEERKVYEQDIADVYIAEMEGATETARDLRSKVRWQRVLQNNPDVVVEYKKRQVNKENQEFLEKNKDDIKTAKQVIDEYLESDDFKKKVREAVKLEKGESITKRRERGQQKISSALDKLANLSGAKKNFVADNDVNTNKADIIEAVTELASGILDLGVANIEDLIHKIKVQTREYLSPTVIDDIKDKVIKATDAENNLQEKKLTAKDVLDSKDIKKVVDKIYSKALKANRADLKRILLESIDVILEEGSIDSNAFQELYAKAAGKPYVDTELSNEIRQSQETINDARKIRNNIESLLDEAIAETKKDSPDTERLKRLEDQIKIQQKEYKKAYREAEKANANLSRIFAPEMTGAQKLSSGVQAGLMTFSTFLLNPLANMVSTIPRTVKMYIEWGLDYGMYRLGTIKEIWLDKLDRKKYPTLYRTIATLPDPIMTRNAPAFSKYYFKNIPSAVKQSFQDVLTGQTPDDAYVREIARGLHPLDAAIRVYERLIGKRKRDFGKLLGDMWESSLGAYAEGVFRLLNLGDKPFRIPAMLARLNEIATIKKLKGLEREKFLINPDEESLNDAVQTGLESTFQQTTKASKMIIQMKNWGNDLPSDNPLSKVAKGFATLFTTTQIPFVKTLVNIANEGAKYTFPWYSGVLGTRDVLRGNRRGALDNYSKAIVANIIGMGIAELMATGLMTLGRGGREEDDDKYNRRKVEKAEYVGDYGANRLNITGTLRYLAGGNPEWRDDDVTINYQGLGIMGVAASAKAEAYRGLSPEEIQEQAWFDYTLGMAWGTLQGVTEQPFFTGPATFLRAFTEGGYALDNWIQNTLSALKVAAIPNTYVAINKYRDNRIREVREKYLEQTKSKGWKEVKNRLISELKPNSDLPVKVSIYGEDVERYKDKQWWNLIDPLKIKRHESDFAFKVFDLYNRTKDESVFPSYPKASIKDKDISNEYVKLDANLYNKYAKTLLSFKATILKAVVNSADWEQMSDNDRVAVLRKIHDMYMREGEAGYIMKKVFIAQNYEELKLLAEKQKKEKEDN
jgi:hypothetical protein